jgi:hypothetical protein
MSFASPGPAVDRPSPTTTGSISNAAGVIGVADAVNDDDPVFVGLAEAVGAVGGFGGGGGSPHDDAAAKVAMMRGKKKKERRIILGARRMPLGGLAEKNAGRIASKSR